MSSDPNVVFSTVLGSCVSVSLFDPAAKLGGLNHYLLPDMDAGKRGDLKYGAQALEVLINDLLKAGASRERLLAKICGGASVVAGLGDIGARNAAFGRDFLRREGFRIVAEDLGGSHARRLQFQPATGAAKITPVTDVAARSVAQSELRPRRATRPDVTLF